MPVVCPVNPPVNISNGPDSNYSKYALYFFMKLKEPVRSFV